ncbi:MAG: hypothetical protein Q9225_002974 [Loekoesia sp. 1 TL-2023]
MNRYGSLRDLPQKVQQLEQTIDQVLIARGISYKIPHQHLATCDLREFPNEVSDVHNRVTDSIRVAKSPAHSAFTLIGSATWDLGFMDSETIREILPQQRHNLLTMAQSDLKQIRRYCSDRFPLGFDEEAVINAIRKAGGSMTALRQILLDAQKPIVILLVLADPRNEKRLALLDEMQRLTESLAATAFRDTFQLQVLANARPDNFAVSLSRMRPTIVHFSGHGSSDGLLFSDQSGQSVSVLPDRLASLLTLARRDGLKAVVMNACYTAEQAKMISTAVQDVVVMDGQLSDAAAIQFSANFYAQLGNGRSFKEAFEWARDADLTGAGVMDARLISTHEEWPTTTINPGEAPASKPSRLHIDTDPTGSTDDIDFKPAASSNILPTPAQVQSDGSQSGSMQSIAEASIIQLTDMGFPKQAAEQALRETNGNVELALALLF